MNKELINTQWKLLANNKQLTATHFIDRAILKAMGAKNKKNAPLDDIIIAILQKSFSVMGEKAIRYLNWYKSLYNNKYATTNGTNILGIPCSSILTPEEYAQFISLASNLRIDKMHRKYVYYFTSQDGLTPEQQGVQAGHALFVLGTKLGPKFNASQTYFQWIGVKTSDDLKEIIRKHVNHRFVPFYEPDLGNRLTSVAFYPILWNMREEFLDYPLLTH